MTSRVCIDCTAKCAGRAEANVELDSREPNFPAATASLFERLWADGEF